MVEEEYARVVVDSDGVKGDDSWDICRVRGAGDGSCCMDEAGLASNMSIRRSSANVTR